MKDAEIKDLVIDHLTAIAAISEWNYREHSEHELVDACCAIARKFYEQGRKDEKRDIFRELYKDND